mmetsp:Transcript_67260/g.184447  ORF Transcript_67260/g.184447 Transcript_67260/m.184447 type:complete len:229 (+) Transcript_67260:360-1046(+)
MRCPMVQRTAERGASSWASCPSPPSLLGRPPGSWRSCRLEPLNQAHCHRRQDVQGGLSLACTLYERSPRRTRSRIPKDPIRRTAQRGLSASNVCLVGSLPGTPPPACSSHSATHRLSCLPSSCIPTCSRSHTRKPSPSSETKTSACIPPDLRRVASACVGDWTIGLPIFSDVLTEHSYPEWRPMLRRYAWVIGSLSSRTIWMRELPSTCTIAGSFSAVPGRALVASTM